MNGKLKFVLDLPVDYGKAEIEKAVMEDERTKALLNGKNLAKLIVVPKKIVNLVIK